MARSVRRERFFWIGAAAALVFVALALVALAVGLRISGVLAVVFVAAVLVARPFTRRYADTHFRLLKGAVAERRVGETLNELRREGWVVMHDVQRPRAAN